MNLISIQKHFLFAVPGAQISLVNTFPLQVECANSLVLIESNRARCRVVVSDGLTANNFKVETVRLSRAADKCVPIRMQFLQAKSKQKLIVTVSSELSSNLFQDINCCVRDVTLA